MRLYRVWVLVAVVATAAGVRAPLGAAAAGIEPAFLKRVASRVESRTGVLTSEASAPVPYVTSQPDPRSFVVELRDVVTAGAVDGFKADPRSPITSVRVDTATAVDGAAVARISVALSQPGRPRVRSSRNLIIVEADRPDVAPATGAIGLAGPTATIQDVRITRVGASTAVTIVGIGQLTPASIRDAGDGRRRVVLEFANVSSAVPRPTTVGQGPVSQVRIGLSPNSPLVTEVAVDLTRPTSPSSSTRTSWPGRKAPWRDNRAPWRDKRASKVRWPRKPVSPCWPPPPTPPRRSRRPRAPRLRLRGRRRTARPPPRATRGIR
jgi:hypothetical protein